MNTPVEVISHTMSELLIHSLWKAALVALALKALLLLTPSRNAAVRCHLASVALVVAAVWSFVPVASHAASPVLAAVAPTVSATSMELSFPAPWLFASWIAGLAIFTFRNLRARSRLSSLARFAPTLPNRHLHARMDALGNQLSIRRPVKLLMSQRIKSPMTFGWLRPVIVFPTSMATGMPAHYLDAILVHELAHIARRDFLVQAFVSFIEALLFFNPGGRWISRQIEREREAACDDIALAAIQSPGTYLSALTQAEELRLSASLEFGGTGTLSRSQRILSLNGYRAKRSLRPDLLLLVTTLIAVSFAIPHFVEAHLGSESAEIENTDLPTNLLQHNYLWTDPKIRDQSIPLFRSVVILEKDGRLLNPENDDNSVFTEFPNAWVREHGLDFLNGALPLTDTDSDGFTNREEFLANTSPVLADSRPSYLHKMEYLGSSQAHYPVRYAARPDPATAQLNGYDNNGRIRSTDLLSEGETTEDKLFEVVTISDQAVTALFTIKNEPVELPKGKTVAPAIHSAQLRLPIGSGELLSVEQGKTFALDLEPDSLFKLETIEPEHCVVSERGGETRKIPVE